MLQCFPQVPLAAQQAIGIALLSYDGRIGVGLIGDADAAKDLPALATDIRFALNELKPAPLSLPSPRALPSPLSLPLRTRSNSWNLMPLLDRPTHQLHWKPSRPAQSPLLLIMGLASAPAPGRLPELNVRPLPRPRLRQPRHRPLRARRRRLSLRDLADDAAAVIEAAGFPRRTSSASRWAA